MDLTTRRISDAVSVGMTSGGLSNSTVIEGQAGTAVMVDALLTPRLARRLLAGLDVNLVEVLVNTHFHGDHTFGNQAVPTETIMAHRGTLARLEQLGTHYVAEMRDRLGGLPDLEDVALELPTHILNGELKFDFGGTTVTVTTVDDIAHTSGDCVVVVGDDEILVAGDLIFDGLVPVLSDGAVGGLTSALESLATRDFDVVIPGHGEPRGSELITRQLDFIDDVFESVEAHVRQGRDGDELTAAVIDDFRHLGSAEGRIPEWVRQLRPLTTDQSVR